MGVAELVGLRTFAVPRPAQPGDAAECVGSAPDRRPGVGRIDGAEELAHGASLPLPRESTSYVDESDHSDDVASQAFRPTSIPHARKHRFARRINEARSGDFTTKGDSMATAAAGG